MIDFAARPLFVFEMANNHMGDVEHGRRIIDRMSEVSQGRAFAFAVKLQYRHLPTFIHPAYRERTDCRYVKRFSETALTEAELRSLREHIAERGMKAICTPFDEPSVDLIEQHGFDSLKIGSCSLTDWPLLERIARTSLPIIASVAGATSDEINNVVSFFQHRERQLAVLHCVGQYPTPDSELQLGQIDQLRAAYPGVPIGFSTHERPDNLEAVKIAVAKGAVIFEKHVGVPTDRYPLNAYSAAPEQVARWLDAAETAFKMCGAAVGRRAPSAKELDDLRGLQRGAFARRRIEPGTALDPQDLFYAIPNVPGQLLANNLSKYIRLTTTATIDEGAPLLRSQVEERDTRAQVLEIIRKVRALILQSGTRLPARSELELSHHFGVERFAEHGAAIISIVNREYCKKLILLLPGQQHPSHAHRLKEETFHILYGDVSLSLDGEARHYAAGDAVTVHRGVKHCFASQGGAVIEEISTTHYRDDSYYDDSAITANPARKTQMTFWSDWLTQPPR